MDTTAATHGRQYGTETHGQAILIAVAELVGHKWYPVLLNELCIEDDRSFSELQAAVDDISNKMLSDSLSALEERGLVCRAVVNDKPVRVRYSLTDRGRELESLLAAMLEWGHENLSLRSAEPPRVPAMATGGPESATGSAANGSATGSATSGSTANGSATGSATSGPATGASTASGSTTGGPIGTLRLGGTDE